MAKKKSTPPPSPLDDLLRCMGFDLPAQARCQFDDLNLLTAEKAFAWLGSVDRLPAGMGLEQFLPLYAAIMGG